MRLKLFLICSYFFNQLLVKTSTARVQRCVPIVTIYFIHTFVWFINLFIWFIHSFHLFYLLFNYSIFWLDDDVTCPFSHTPSPLQESRAHRIKAKLLSFWEWMGDLRGFGKPKTFQTKYFLWRILIWLLSNTTCIAGCQAFRTSLAGQLIEAKSQVNLNQFSKNMRGIEPQFDFLNFER